MPSTSTAARRSTRGYDDLFDGGGSAGCVHLRLEHAKTLWDRLGIGDQVYVRGRKPGT
ncbi:L,D-transpeptidase family protein [Streptomyces sp. MMS24-I29]|uniref:L,D-transpeptidase family protein n=1 Tax=Streptomyces sp. MMS24-I29 TaxID=3351480 RepID=UPI003C7B6E1D